MSVTAISPTSLSPPASIGHSYTNSLPPIQTLPTWTRSKFDKLLRNVPPNDSGRKRAADLYSRDRTEICTQTSRSSSKSTINAAPRRSDTILASVEKQKRSLEKKIVFLEANHTETLKRLHRELEKVKNENKKLQFQLVIDVENDELANKKSARHYAEQQNLQEATVLRDEIQELKRLLHLAYAENNQLKKHRDITETKQATKSVQSPKDTRRHKSMHPVTDDGTWNRGPLEAPLGPGVDPRIGDGKGDVKCDVVDVSVALESVWRRMQEQHLSDRHRNNYQNLPSPNPKTFILPKLAHKNNSRIIALANNSPYSNNMTNRKIPERIMLPMLQQQCPPENRANITNRQKRAKALHVRRQRISSQDVTVCATHGDDFSQ